MPDVAVGSVADFPDGRGVPVAAAGRRIAVFRIGERVFAVDDFCPHRGFPLNDGSVDGSLVRCRTHGSCFDLETGEVRRGPANRGVRAYPARIADGQIFIAVD